MEENGDKKENEESKENLETKEESENEKESKENKNKDEENNIIIEQNKDKEINIQEKEKDDSEDKNEIIIENKEQQKENNKEEIKENDEIKINIINEEKNDKSEIKNKILSEKSIEEIIDKDNDQIINIEEKENSEEDEPEYSKNDIEALYLRTKSNKSMKLEQFYEQKRHYFIMTEGGTPIYSRYGDEIQNCSLLATFSAIITKFTIFNNEKNSQEKLNYICNDNSIIAFLKKGKIVFIALSNKTDSLSFLYSQLELLYQQLLSIVTSERMPILEEKPSSCSTVLSGINESMEQMIEYSSNTLVGLLSSYQVLPIENRQRLNNICHKYLKNALICCLMTPDAKQIISLSKSNIINLSFNDIILIQCLIMSSDSLRSGESWVPICLPGISSEGFLQLYCNFVTTDKFGIIFVTESQEQKYFNDFVNLSRKIYNEIEEQKYLKNIENSLKKNEIKKEISEKNEVSKIKDFIEGTIGVKEVIDKKEKEKNIRIQIHKNIIPKKVSIYYGVYNPDNDFIKDPLIKLKYGLVRNKLIGQFFTINFSNNDEISPNEKYIYSKYIKLHDMFISMNTTTVDVDNYFHIEKDNKYTHGIYVTDTYAIFGTFNLFKSNEEVHGLLKEIAKLIKSHDSNFFINFK
jgi:actin-related protein 3